VYSRSRRTASLLYLNLWSELDGRYNSRTVRRHSRWAVMQAGPLAESPPALPSLCTAELVPAP
jgi:hypothetical protein